MTVVGLRPATPADSEFCFQLHKAAMGDYVTAIWGWDEQVQRDYHTRAFDPDHWRIITADGADIGMLSVEYRPTEIYRGAIRDRNTLVRSPVRPNRKRRLAGEQIPRSSSASYGGTEVTKLITSDGWQKSTRSGTQEGNCVEVKAMLK